MFELDPQASYMMPAHFGSRMQSPRASGWYRDVTSMTVAFRTESRCLDQWLPAPFSVDEEPTVTVTYARNRQVDWLAGHGYNLLSVNCGARFQGEKDVLAGKYCLVIWENLADPILTGRELQGIPKIYADIPDHSEIEGEWRCTASHFGHSFFDMEICDLREPTTEEVVANAAALRDRDNPMGWRFMGGVGGFGEAVNEFTTYPSENHIEEAWVGRGTLRWIPQTWEQNPTQFHIINALADLPVLEWLPALIARGSTNLVLPERLPRRIE